MKKVIYLMIMLMFGFGFLGSVSAIEGDDGTINISDEVEETTAGGDTEEEAGTEENMEATAEEEEDNYYEETNSNPDTGLNDYIMYIVPVLLIGGSVLMFRRNSYN